MTCEKRIIHVLTTHKNTVKRKINWNKRPMDLTRWTIQITHTHTHIREMNERVRVIIYWWLSRQIINLSNEEKRQSVKCVAKMPLEFSLYLVSGRILTLKNIIIYSFGRAIVNWWGRERKSTNSIHSHCHYESYILMQLIFGLA